jgi:hypothetical protein
MRYPIVRVNTDGSRVVVRNREEAYAEPERIAVFLPDAPIPEDAPAELEPVEAPEAVKRSPGRPKKVVA